MVISINRKNPIMLIECKKADSSLNKTHYKQLAEYFEMHKESKLGVLTNGIIYKFFSVKWNDSKSLNEKPFLVFNLDDFTRADLDDLSNFHIKLFNKENIISIAEEKYFLDDFDDGLVKTLYPASIDFRKLVYQNMGGLRMTEKISDRIFQLINSISLQEAVEKVKILEGKDSSSGIYTSSEELKAFQIIKTIIALTPRLKNKLDRVNYKDYKGQFKIIVDNMPSKEICHLIFNENSKKINFNGSISLLSKVSADEIAKHKKAIVDSAIKYLIGDE